MIVVVGGIKGGSGKTTLATNLAVMRSKKNRVLLVDSDEQRSATHWNDQRESSGYDSPWVTIELGGENMGSQIKKMVQDYDDIIVDVGGRNTTSQRAALTVADVYLVPFLPRSIDIWTLGQLRDMIINIVSINEKIKCYSIINRGDFAGNDNQDAIDVISECPHLTCIPIIIGQRKSFANASTYGLGVIEMKSGDKKAIHEMNMLHDYIYK